MLVVNVSDFIKNTLGVLNAALNDEVIINNDGIQYKILPIKNEKIKGKSPLEDIPYITADITMQEIVEIIRESRAGI